MKTKLLLTIGILFFAILAKSQAIVRPPINTESIYLTNFIWENDLIMKDSLYYIRFDNDRCFSIKGLYAGDEWEQLCAPNDSIYIAALDITICNGCFITTDTTQFYVKRDPCEYNCWLYSYDNVTWYDWFCEPPAKVLLQLFPETENVMEVWHKNYMDDMDSIGFKINDRYDNKYLHYTNDSIYWGEILNDSLFVDGIWYNLPDTLPINVDSLIYVNNVPISIGDTIFTHDSIYYNGAWVQNDTIHIVDNSITNELDSFYYAGSWIKNGMTLTVPVPAIPPLYYIINGKYYYNQSEITIDESKWDRYTDIYFDNIYTNDEVAIGVESCGGSKLKVVGNDIYPAISANQTSTGYSGSFSGGSGLYTDSLNTPKANISEGLTVGDSTVTTIRSGATFTIWQGTQAAYDAIGTKDAKTIYYIEQNFNIIQILFFLLMFFGSRGVFGQSNWAAVNIGTTEMKKIYVGDKLVWEKTGGMDTVMTMSTTSTSATWSPREVIKTGATLHWEVTGAVTTSADLNKPTFDFSPPGTKYITVTASDGGGGLTSLSCYYNYLTTLDVSSCINLSHLDCFNNQLTALDVSNNTNFLYLDCHSNQLTTLDVSNNTNLSTLYCNSNHLTTTAINSILDNLILFGIDGQYLYCFSQTPPASPDLSKVAALRALGWAVYY